MTLRLYVLILSKNVGVLCLEIIIFLNVSGKFILSKYSLLVIDKLLMVINFLFIEISHLNSRPYKLI